MSAEAAASAASAPPSTSLSIVPEGPLRDWYIEGLLLVDSSNAIKLPPLSVSVLDVWEMDVSKYYPSRLFPPDITYAHTKRTIIRPILLASDVRDARYPIVSGIRPRVLDMDRVGTVELMLRLRRTPDGIAHDVHVPKLKLYWREHGAVASGVGAVVEQGMTGDPTILEFPEVIGAVGSASERIHQQESIAERSVTVQTPNLYMEWEMSSGGQTPLIGKVLLVRHESGMTWRFINDKDGWWLHSFTAVLVAQELSVKRGGDLVANMSMRTERSTTVTLACRVDRVWNLSDEPTIPRTAIRVINGSWQSVPFSLGSPGWVLVVDIHEQNVDSCDATLPVDGVLGTLSARDLVLNPDFTSIRPQGGIGEVRMETNRAWTWVVRRHGSTDFKVLYALFYSA